MARSSEVAAERGGPATHADARERRIAEYEQRFEAIARVAGADLSDGMPSWPDPGTFALQEVQTLRENYDEALKDASLSPLTTQDGAGE